MADSRPVLRALMWAVLVATIVCNVLFVQAGPSFAEDIDDSRVGRASRLDSYGGYYNHNDQVACFKETQLSHCASFSGLTDGQFSFQ